MFLIIPHSFLATAQTQSDTATIVTTVLNYIEGWYKGNAKRMANSLHRQLINRSLTVNVRTGETELKTMDFVEFVVLTDYGYGKKTPRDQRQKIYIFLEKK